MRKFLYFLSADARHLQTRLDRLRDQGLELTSTEGFFCGEFQKTLRTDLHYLVVPCGGTRHFPQNDDFAHYGWELAGGFNGMAIFKSIPCAEPDQEGLLAKLRQDGCVREDRWTVPLMLVLLLAWTLLLLFWMGQWNPGSWYLSYGEMGRLFLLGVSVLVTAANLVTLRSYPSAWVHGLTPPILVGSLLVLILLTMLDETAHPLYFAGFLVLIALACAVTLWLRARKLGLGLAAVCLVVLCVGLVFPNVSWSESSGKGLHNEVADRPVVQLADLGVEESLTGTGYETEGTFLVRSTSYWEISEDASVSSQVYHCLTQGLTRDLLRQLLATGSWQQTDYGWTSREGKAVLLWKGNAVAEVVYSEPLALEQIEAMEAQVF